jgi:coproporphyrinogen III oxidase-like Fe-S oxidoreductase
MGLGNPLMKRPININVPKIQYIHALFKPELCTYCGLKNLQTQGWQILHTVGYQVHILPVINLQHFLLKKQCIIHPYGLGLALLEEKVLH